MGKSSELLSLLKTGNSDAARRLIAKLKKSGKKKALTKELNVPDDSGQTVIHFCAAQNFVEFLQDLAELGASIDIADNKGYTPLHLAARSGRTSAVTALVNRGADPNISSRTGDTALHLACSGGHATSVVSLLLRSGQFSSSYLQRSDMPHTALLLAAKQGHIECIGLLVKHGFDVNRKLPGSNSGTALHEAALYGKVDSVRYLLQCGADIQQTNSQGLTALDIVNMYTDPRSAMQMKQVLQDALAHQARTRIAQQHAVQQHHPHPHQTPLSHPHQTPLSHLHQPPLTPHHSTHPQPSSYAYPSPNTPSTPHCQQQGFSYFQAAATHQPVLQQRVSSELAGSPRQQQRQHDLPSLSHHGAAVGVSSVPQHRQARASQAAATVPYKQQGMVRDSTGYAPLQDRDTMGSGNYTSSRLQSQTEEYHYQHPSSQPAAPPQAMGHVQHIYPRPGSPEGVHKTSSGIGGDLAAIIAAKAASRKPMVTSPTRKEHQTEDLFSRSMTVGADSTVMDARYTALRRCSSTSDRSSDSPERSEPPTLTHRSQGGPPSFKPVPPPSNVDRAMHLVDRHMVSSENGSGSDPLQRRFAPSKTSGGERATAPHTERIAQLKKPPSRAPPPSQPEAADNELMAKLLRRQNKMTEAEQAPLPAPEPASPTEENKDEERNPPELQRPPPPPERRTPLMTPQLSQPSTQPAVIQTPLPVVEKASETSAVPTPTTTTSAPAPTSVTSAPAPTSVKPRAPKAPPPKFKEPEPELTPWQQELAARKARLADHVKEEEEEEEEQKRKNDTPSEGPPPIAPKSKRKDPGPCPPSHPSPPKPPPSQPPPSQPPPSQPPPSQLPSSQLPPSQPPPSYLSPSQVSPSHLPPSQLLSFQPALSVSTEEPRLVAGLHRKHPPEAGSAKPKPALADVHQTLPEVKAEAVTALHVSSTADQMSRSTSLSSLTTTTGTGSPQLSCMEHMAISDWLTGYKLSDYIPLLESNGYETTELLVDITQEELADLGVHKVGHRKKLISALSNWPQKEHFFLSKPSNVPAWLSVLGLIQYEAVMLDAGYDDIDFICDITIDDLHDLGITKIGHIRRLIRGIGELTELMKEVPIPSAISDPSFPLVSTSANGPTSLAPAVNSSLVSDDRDRSSELRLDPLGLQQHSADQPTQSPEKVDFVKMKDRLERKMGLNRTSEEIRSSGEESIGASRVASHSPSVSPLPQRKMVPQVVAADTDFAAVLQQSLPPPIPSHRELKHLTVDMQPVPDLPPQLPPKRGRKHAPPPTFEGDDASDGPAGPAAWKKYSVEDITAVLNDGSLLTHEVATGGEGAKTGKVPEQGANEFDQLAAALHGFELESDNTPDQPEQEPDQLLADIDGMLADLTTHLDTMIP